MSINKLFNLAFFFVARSCEKSSIIAGIIRYLNFRGKGRIIQQIRADSMRKEVTANCGGIRYHLNLRDDVQRELYFNVYERADLQAVIEITPVGGTCLDIGANNGAFALPLAKRVGTRGVVHAFEADASVFARLQSNCRLNRFESFMKCHHVAVSNVTGSLPFHSSDPEHSGWGSLVEFKDIAVSEQTVPAITVDDFLRTENVGLVDLLKVDVEAHEPELLVGAKNSLANHVFRFILIEFNGIRLAERGTSLEDFLKPLEISGYSPIRFRLELLRKMRDKIVSPNEVCTNFLFAAQD